MPAVAARTFGVSHSGVWNRRFVEHPAKDEYRFLCRGAYLDGIINVRERRLLDKKRMELGLSTEEAELIERKCAPDNVVEYTRFVEGVLVDGVITEVERAFLEKKARQLHLNPGLAREIEEVALAMKKGALEDVE